MQEAKSRERRLALDEARCVREIAQGGGFTAGAYYKGTDAEEAAYTIKGKDWSKDRLVAFVAWTF